MPQGKLRRSRGKGLIFGTFGDYEYNKRSLTLLNARLEFVYAISRCSPNVFEALHDEPLAKYKESGLLSINSMMRHGFWEEIIGGRDKNYYFNAAPRGIEHLPLRGGRQNLKCNVMLVAHFQLDQAYDAQVRRRFCKAQFPKIRAFMDSLGAWASAHHLEFGWMLHWAFLKLDSYTDLTAGQKPGSYRLFRVFSLGDIFGKDVQPQLIEPGGLYDYSVGMELEPFCFNLRGWRPSLQTAAGYEDFARWWFERNLKEYLEDAQSKLNANIDVGPIRVKIERAHFDWLVYRQVNGMTADEILKVWSQRTDDEAKQHRRHDLSAQGVNKAIKEAARLVGFTPRKVGRGPSVKH
jgi:uncharacterized protein (DUF1810 family)